MTMIIFIYIIKIIVLYNYYCIKKKGSKQNMFTQNLHEFINFIDYLIILLILLYYKMCLIK